MSPPDAVNTTQKPKKIYTFTQWVEERKKLSWDEIMDIEAKAQGLTVIEKPEELRIVPDKPITFSDWVEERKKLSWDEIMDIEAEAQGLYITDKPKQLTPMAEKELTFADWVEERKKLSWDEIMDIEAEAQGLKLIKPRKPPPPIKPVVKPELLIERIPYPRWWRDSLNAKIDLVAPATQTLASVTGALRLWVATIVITVTGETAITITFGNAGASGPIYLGGENQPMGIVIAMGHSPAPCGDGNLVIAATDPGAVNPLVGGWATCFAEEFRKK